jgi:large subunit ribosomal protein L2
MALRKYSRATPGQRHRIRLLNLPKYGILRKINIKKLQYHIQNKRGRNNTGKITVQGQGGGNFRNYKIIDFKRQLWNQPGIVKSLIYDRNRSALLALIIYNNGLRSYQIATQGLYIGQKIESGLNRPIYNGNSLPLIAIPTGIPICLINGKLCRRAGSYRTIIKKDFKLGLRIISLRSGIFKRIPLNIMATIGQISNIDHKNQIYGKAGVSRWYNIRPTVRGVAKNPIDHPHGGGNGKTSGGRPSVTPYGRCTKGTKTRKRPHNIYHSIKL